MAEGLEAAFGMEVDGDGEDNSEYEGEEEGAGNLWVFGAL